jgi:hypothetical protein
MIDLLFSRLMAMMAGVALLGCALSAFSQINNDEEEDSFGAEAMQIRRLFADVGGEGEGSVTAHGEELLGDGQSVALVGNSLVLRFEGRSILLAELDDLRNALDGTWSRGRDLCICWNDSGLYLYLLNESANFSTASESLRHSSLVL